jgi:hypothetical protein
LWRIISEELVYLQQCWLALSFSAALLRFKPGIVTTSARSKCVKPSKIFTMLSGSTVIIAIRRVTAAGNWKKPAKDATMIAIMTGITAGIMTETATGTDQDNLRSRSSRAVTPLFSGFNL